MRILVVEDELVSRTKLGVMLSQWGVVDLAETGAAARSMFHTALDEGLPYDLIIFDIELPDANGIDLLQELKQTEGCIDTGDWRSRTIVITGDSNVKNVLKARNACCDAFLVKPVSLEILRKKMREIWTAPVIS